MDEARGEGFPSRMARIARERRRLDGEGCRDPHWGRDERPGLVLKLWRLQIGVSQRAASAEAGLDQSEISRIEAGRDARWSSLERLAFALGCALEIRLRPLAGKVPERAMTQARRGRRGGER